MAERKLYGVKNACDEAMAAGIRRRREPPQILSGLLKAEIAEQQARSSNIR
jgi:hypothetical protein